MRCSICGNDILPNSYIWNNVPVNGDMYSPVCDKCAKIYLGAYLEENGPEFSRESCSNPSLYKEAVELMSGIKND